MPSNHARNVALTPQLNQFIDELVEGGNYGNASEVIRDGLRELKRKVTTDQLSEIRQRVSVGLDQLDHGDGIVGSPSEVLGSRLEAAKVRATS